MYTGIDRITKIIKIPNIITNYVIIAVLKIHLNMCNRNCIPITIAGGKYFVTKLFTTFCHIDSCLLPLNKRTMYQNSFH